MRVIISNPTRLHAHRHAYALQEAGYLQKFLTSIWYKPERFPYSYMGFLPSGFRRKVTSFLSKRSHDGLVSDKVKQFWKTECFRLVSDTLFRRRKRDQFLLDQKLKYDASVAKYLVHNLPDIFVGFEISCAQSFSAARALGVKTVLDIAGLAHDFAIENRPDYLFDSSDLQESLRHQKQQELALVDAIICTSDLAKKSFMASGVEEGKITIIHLGLDNQIFNAKGRVWDREGEPFRICYAGNLSRAKGVDVLIKAFQMAGLDNAELCLAGSFVDIEPSLSEAPNISLLSYLEPKLLAELFRSSDLFILPTFFDSWGMVVPEAMACGLPVITTDMCGASELISSKNGSVIKAGDVEKLADEIVKLYSDRKQLLSMGRDSVQTVSTLSWNKYNENIRAFHESLIE